MFKLQTAVFISLFSASLLGPALGGGEDEPDSILYETPDMIVEVAHLPPTPPCDIKDALAAQNAGAPYLPLVWEPLFRTDGKTGALLPALADRHASILPHRLHVVTLSPGAAWSDGTPVRAEQVARVIKGALAMDAVMSPLHQSLKQSVREVFFHHQPATGTEVLVFWLNAPDPRFPHKHFALAPSGSFPILRPVTQVQGGGSKPCRPALGTGPYRWGRSAVTDLLVRSEAWWDEPGPLADRPVPSALRLRVEGNLAVRTAALRAANDNRIDLALPIPATFAPRLEAPTLLWDGNPPFGFGARCVRRLEFNLAHPAAEGDVPASPWHDPQLRKALSLLVDRADVVDRAYDGAARPATSPFAADRVPPGLHKRLRDMNLLLPESAKPREARRLFKEEGYHRCDPDEPSNQPCDEGQQTGECRPGCPAPDHPDEINEGPTPAEGRFLVTRRSNRNVPLTLTLLIPDTPAEFGRAAHELARQFRQGGVNVLIERLANEDYEQALVQRAGWDVTYGVFGCGATTDPADTLLRYGLPLPGLNAPFNPTLRNPGGWDGPRARAYSSYVRRLALTPPSDPRIPRLAALAWRHAQADLPFLPIVHPAEIHPANQSVWGGWPQAALGDAPAAQTRIDGFGFLELTIPEREEN